MKIDRKCHFNGKKAIEKNEKLWYNKTKSFLKKEEM